MTAVEPTTASGSSSGTPSGGPGGSRGGGIAVRLLIALVALGAVAGLVFVLLPDSTPSATTVVPGPAASDPLAPPPPTLASVAPLTASTPLRVHVPSIFADSSLVPVGVDAQNKVQVPPVSQPMQAAWYERAPTPGAAGPALILGHVNGGGKPGIFANLHTVREGQEIDVDRADGATAVFTVFHTETVPKDAFPTQRVYGNVPDAQLRLVTCGGDLDRQAHNYLSNVIVYATLTGVRRT